MDNGTAAVELLLTFQRQGARGFLPRYHLSVDVLAAYEVRGERRIELCQGDLATDGPSDPSDLLLISAFPDDYLPTASSLIGQLARRGLSVSELAADKDADLRSTTSCWISKLIDGGRERYGFDRILCYEPRAPAQAAEAVGDIFRALVPYVGPTPSVSTVATSVLASGDMARPVDTMLQAILDAGLRWMTAGLALERLRIVSRDERTVREASRSFARWSARNHPYEPASAVDPSVGDSEDKSPDAVDVFISYAREDGSATADSVVRLVTAFRPATNVFLDRLSIDVGTAWQQHIANAIDATKKVVVVLTPGFLLSKVCQEELNMARLKDLESSEPVIFPIYVLSCQRLPLHLRVLNYVDCREENAVLIEAACQSLVRTL